MSDIENQNAPKRSGANACSQVTLADAPAKTIGGIETVAMQFRQAIKRWEFPKERFVNYEDSDEPWCRFFGIGREVTEEVWVDLPRCVPTSSEVKINRLGERYIETSFVVYPAE